MKDLLNQNSKTIPTPLITAVVCEWCGATVEQLYQDNGCKACTLERLKRVIPVIQGFDKIRSVNPVPYKGYKMIYKTGW